MFAYYDLAYCDECGDLVPYDILHQIINEKYRDIRISYSFHVGRCKHCYREVATDKNYIFRKSEAKSEAYRKLVN